MSFVRSIPLCDAMFGGPDWVKCRHEIIMLMLNHFTARLTDPSSFGDAIILSLSGWRPLPLSWLWTNTHALCIYTHQTMQNPWQSLGGGGHTLSFNVGLCHFCFRTNTYICTHHDSPNNTKYLWFSLLWTDAFTEGKMNYHEIYSSLLHGKIEQCQFPPCSFLQCHSFP